jgi:hypothetical protein
MIPPESQTANVRRQLRVSGRGIRGGWPQQNRTVGSAGFRRGSVAWDERGECTGARRTYLGTGVVAGSAGFQPASSPAGRGAGGTGGSAPGPGAPTWDPESWLGALASSRHLLPLAVAWEERGGVHRGPAHLPGNRTRGRERWLPAGIFSRCPWRGEEGNRYRAILDAYNPPPNKPPSGMGGGTFGKGLGIQTMS